ncbi:MAG: DEAD/DEAH box helicase [Spirochaetes bacterium]|nr:DEAD/DEAH box helicase [Spirochaetota bacterium]
MKFTEFNLHPELQRAIDEAGFHECFPVQVETLKRTLAGKDVLVQSKTGTGKTAAFLITIFQHLSSTESFKGKKALIIVPTRELATQIEEEAKLLGKYLPFRIGSFYGGIGYTKQEALLREGVDIIIGTPGRLIDFSHQRKLDLHAIGILVIDEADRLFDMGFLPDLRKLLRRMGDSKNRLTMLLSATLSLRVSTLAWEYMNEAEEIVIDPEQVTVDTITQVVYHVGSSEKFSLLLGILQKHNPKSVIIFTNTKQAAEEVSKRLELNGYKSQYIIGDLPQRKRLRILDDLKSNRINILVATDVAARGLHIEDLDMVVNYDVPEDPENYVHRIGRTARVGKSGKAIMLACERYVFGLEAIEKFIGMKIPVESFDESLLLEDKSAGRKIERDSFRSSSKALHASPRDRRSSRVLRKPHRDHVKRTAPVPAGIGIKAIKEGQGEKRRVTRKGNAQSLEERLSLYQKKYGEQFKPGGEPTKASYPSEVAPSTSVPSTDRGKKPGILSRILSLFKR